MPLRSGQRSEGVMKWVLGLPHSTPAQGKGQEEMPDSHLPGPGPGPSPGLENLGNVELSIGIYLVLTLEGREKLFLYS